MQIVHAIIQRDRRHLQTEADPVRGDVLEIIEIDARHGQIPEFIKRRRTSDVAQFRTRRSAFKRKRNKTREPAGLILQCPQLPQMIHTLLERFHMSKEHRRRAAHPHFVPRAVHIRPFLRRLLPAADSIAHTGIEYLCAAARQSLKARILELRERVTDGHFKDPFGEMADFHRGKSLDEKRRTQRPHAREQFEIPIRFQRRMKPADHVNLGDAAIEPDLYATQDFIDRQLERMILILPRAERAKLASEDAMVRIIYVEVVNVSAGVSVLPFPHDVREETHGV